jgi:hypothetical protein
VDSVFVDQCGSHGQSAETADGGAAIVVAVEKQNCVIYVTNLNFCVWRHSSKICVFCFCFFSFHSQRRYLFVWFATYPGGIEIDIAKHLSTFRVSVIASDAVQLKWL